jgi:hypothetical protein
MENRVHLCRPRAERRAAARPARIPPGDRMRRAAGEGSS